MAANLICERLSSLSSKRQVCVVGAAVIDVIADAYSLPHRGSDIELHQQGVNIGGCALNVAIALHRLGVGSLNALPLGQGIWADIIRNAIANQGIETALADVEGENGWCLALVEPDGERTFLSVSGVENSWSPELLARLSIAPDALVYMSGYQISADSGEVLVSWLETLPESVEIFIDFGPRLADIKTDLLDRIMALRPIVSLNRQEAEYLGLSTQDDSVEQFALRWRATWQCPLILRVDSEGAYFCEEKQAGWLLPYKTKVVDTIGAGDSHAGGVLSGLASGWTLAEAVQLGNAVASYVVSHRGGDSAPFTHELQEYLSVYENQS